MKRISFLLLVALLNITACVEAQTIFPAEFTAPAEFNTGTVHISVLSRSERQMTTNFLFEQGSRNSWHYHPSATQVLMVLSGEAYYQEEGQPKQLLRKGDVVTTAPNVRHWNGATPWNAAECMTVTEIVEGEEHAVQLRKVTDEEFSSPIADGTMLVRLAEIEIHPQYLTEYLAAAAEIQQESLRTEPGVLCLFPTQMKEDSTQVRILKIYASQEAYQHHIQTAHFQKYKQGTLHMVKSLKLQDLSPLNRETMDMIFKRKN